jgi:ribonucleotide reductase alpha subunit
MELKRNGTHQFLVYADDVNLLGVQQGKTEADLEVNMERTKCMSTSRHQNAGQNHDIKTVNRSSENVEQFKYMRTIATNQNFIHEEINSRLNSGNACYHSIKNLLSSRLLSKNANIKTYNTLILLVLLYKYRSLSLTLREEHRLRVFANRVLRIFGRMK